MIMIGILQWMLKLQIELIELVEQKMFMCTDSLQKEQLRRELSKEHNKNKMFNQLSIQEGFREINLNLKKYYKYYNYRCFNCYLTNRKWMKLLPISLLLKDKRKRRNLLNKK